MPCQRGIFLCPDKRSRILHLTIQNAAPVRLIAEPVQARPIIPAGPLRSPGCARRSGRGCAAGQTGVFLIVLHHYTIVSILSQVRHYCEDSLLVFLLRASPLCSRSLVKYVAAFSRQKVTVSFRMPLSRNLSHSCTTHIFQLFYLFWSTGHFIQIIIVISSFCRVLSISIWPIAFLQFYRINAIF